MDDRLQCAQCLVRQTIDAARLITSDATIHQMILSKAFIARSQYASAKRGAEHATV